MSKRRSGETDEERWLRKKKKYESKLWKGGKSVIIYSDEEIPNEENWDQETYPNSESEITTPIELDPITDIHMSHEPLSQTPFEPVEPPAPTEPTFPSGASPTSDTIDLDVNPDLLEALGKLEEETTEWGDPVIEHIAMRLKPLLTSGLKKEERENLIKKYPFPKNISLSKAPTLNAEVSAMLTETSRNRDKRLYNKQNQLGRVLSAVTKAMSLLLRKESKIADTLSILSDASKLLADSHFLETDTRRSLITPMVDKNLIDTIKERKRDDYLFGDGLGELVKNSRGIRKTGQLIQAIPSGSNLNYRGPSSRGRQQRSYANRGGGHQRSYRRAAPHGPPSAPPRRQPQAHYVPQRRRQPPPGVMNIPRNAPTASATDRATPGTHL